MDQKLLQIASLAIQLRQELVNLALERGPGSQCIKDEMPAFEAFDESSIALAHAARILAMRFNRGAVGSFNPLPTSILA